MLVHEISSMALDCDVDNMQSRRRSSNVGVEISSQKG